MTALEWATQQNHQSVIQVIHGMSAASVCMLSRCVMCVYHVYVFDNVLSCIYVLELCLPVCAGGATYISTFTHTVVVLVIRTWFTSNPLVDAHCHQSTPSREVSISICIAAPLSCQCLLVGMCVPPLLHLTLSSEICQHCAQ